MSRQRKAKKKLATERTQRGEASAAGQSAGEPWPLWAALAALVLGYLALFFQTPLGGQEGVSRGMLLLLIPFDPGAILGNWIGGAWERVGVWDRAPVLLLVAIWLACGVVVGQLLFRLFRINAAADLAEQLCFAAPLGLHLLSLLVLLFGLLANWLEAPILLTRWPLLAILLGVTAFAIAERRARRKSSAAVDSNSDDAASGGNRAGVAQLSVAPGQDETGEPRWLLLLAIPFALLLIGSSILPPWEFDVREYHLQASKEWFRGGGIGFMPHNVYANMPQGAEMHALAGMILWGGDEGWWRGALVGKGIIGSLNLLTAFALYVGVRRRVGRFGAAAACVLYASWPFAFHVAAAGLIDAALALYVVLTFLALLRWWDCIAQDNEEGTAESCTAWLKVAGLAAGAAASCKYPGVLFAILPAAAVVAVLPVWRRGAGYAARASLLFLVFAGASAAPWYAKNLVLTGNPTYPLLASIFGGETRTAAKNQQWRAAHAIPKDPSGNSFTPAQLAGAAANVLWRFPQHHPLTVPLALLGLWSLRSRRSAAAAWAAALLLFVLWFGLTHRIDRFWLPLGPLLCFAAGLGVGAGRSQAWRGVMTIVLATASFFVFSYCASRYLTPENRILVAYSELRRDAPHPEDPGQWTLSASHDFLNRSTPVGKSVLLVGDAQPFNLDPKTYYSTCFDDCLLEVWMREGGESLQRELRDRDVAYVLVDWGEISRYRATYGFTDFVQPEIFAQLVGDNVLRPTSYPGESRAVQIFAVNGLAAEGD